MAKLFVEVKTPGNGKIYEFQVDSAMSVGKAKAGMIEEIVEAENGNITLEPEKALLCALDTRLALSDTDTLKSAGVRSGYRLLLL